MEKRRTSAVDRLLGSTLLGATGLTVKFLDRLAREITAQRLLYNQPEEIAQAAREALDKFEPLLAQHLSDATLASWIVGYDAVAKLFPPWLLQEFQTGIRSDVPPSTPPRFFEMFNQDKEPELKLLNVENAAQRLMEREILTRDDFDEASEQAKADAFTVAGDLKEDTIGRLRDFLVEEIHDGTSLKGFRNRIEEHLKTSPVGPGHLETVYRTNVQGALRDGRATLANNTIVQDVFPYQEYIPIEDGRTRHDHLALGRLGLNGTAVYRVDDPVWDYFTPPWDYNCRCGTRLMTIDQAAKAGVVEAQQWLSTGVAPITPEHRIGAVFAEGIEPKAGWGARGKTGVMVLSTLRMSIMMMAGDRHRAPAGYTKDNPLVIAGHEYTGGNFIPAEHFDQATDEQKEIIQEGRRPSAKPTKQEVQDRPKSTLEAPQKLRDKLAKTHRLKLQHGFSVKIGYDSKAKSRGYYVKSYREPGGTKYRFDERFKTPEEAATLGADFLLGRYKEKAPVSPKAAPKADPRESIQPPTKPQEEPKSRKRKAPNEGNWRYENTDFFASGTKSKFKDNLAALKLLKTLELEDRQATPEEQATLSKYVGWGQFPALFSYDYRNANAYRNWSKERQELEQVIGAEAFASARRSITNSHYTHPDVINANWEMAKRLGFSGGKLLEPAVGSGYYLGFMPEDLAKKTSVTAVEMDHVSGELAKQLYPGANVKVKPFEQTPTPDNFYDMVATNVPFDGKVRITDPKYKGMKPLLHDYYFLRAVDTTKPGGLMMLVTSAGTMDKLDSRVRSHLEKNAELVSAVRFPGDTHKENAGTDVVTDMIILRKKNPDVPPPDADTPEEALPPKKGENGHLFNGGFTGVTVDSLGRLYHWVNGVRVPGPKWDDTVEVADPDGGDPIRVNRYFAENPDQILGRLDRTGTMYTGNMKNVSRTGDYEQQLKDAIDRLPENILRTEKTAKKEPLRIEADQPYNEGQLVVQDGQLYRHENGALVPERANKKDLERIEGQIEIRDAARKLIAAQHAGEGSDEARAELNAVYDSYVDKHGPLNNRTNVKAMRNDPDGPFLQSLEEYNSTTKQADKAAMFEKDTIAADVKHAQASNVGEAVGITLHESGSVDFDRIQELTGFEQADIERQLVEQGLAYNDPANGWTSAALYLSGNTRKKLREAEVAAEADAQFQANVDALRQHQPDDIPTDEIGIKLGAPWVPPEIVQNFAAETLGVRPEYINVRYVPASGEWYVDLDSMARSRASNRLVWGVKDDDGGLAFDFQTALRHALSGRAPIIRSAYKEEGKTAPVLTEATESAKEKIEELKSQFKEWVWEDPERAESLFREYNDNYNNVVPTEFDGSHLTFPGMRTNGWPLRKLQKDFVWRVITTGKGLAAHEVGTGKTASMVAGAMELRRLGLAKKPAIAVLKSNIEQITAEALELYPGAKILSTASMFDSKKRQKTLNQIATGDYDMVILTHDHLNMMKMKPQTQQKFLQEEIAELTDAILSAEAEKVSRGEKKQSNRIVKRLESQKQKLEQQLRAAIADEGKDDIYFEDSGIDQLFVDEAHKFKSLPCHTGKGQIKGIPTQRSQRATNMFMRTRWLMENNNGRGVVFATGTPIANTMGEMYNMQRYLQYDSLKERGLDRFDAWADTYGDTTNRIEFKLNGDVAATTRFNEFVNLPELRHLASEFMDVQRVDNLFNPDGSPMIQRPKRSDQIVVSEDNDSMQEFMQGIHERAEALKGKRVNEKGEDNMLSVCNDAKLGSLDMRLVNPDAPDHPQSKANQAVRKIVELYNEHPEQIQAVFSDIGIHENSRGFSVFKDMKRKLVAAGIPEGEILDFSDEKMKDSARSEAQDRLRRGDAKIAFGSTQRLGTGTNIQKRLRAIHHLDIPYVPAYLEQRDGRGYRSGNKNEDLDIYRYVQQGSADNLFWQIVANKSNFINQYMLGKGNRTMQDLDTETLTPDEMMAVATGDETMMERVQLEDEVRKLNRAKTRHATDREKMRASIERGPETATEMRHQLEGHRRNREHLERNPDFNLRITTGRHGVHNDRKPAGDALQDAIGHATDVMANSSSWNRPSQIPIANYRGMEVAMRQDGMLEVKGPSGESYRAGPSLQSVEYAARKIKDHETDAADRIAEHKLDIERMKNALSQPFRYESDLTAKQRRLEELKAARQARVSRMSTDARGNLHGEAGSGKGGQFVSKPTSGGQTEKSKRSVEGEKHSKRGGSASANSRKMRKQKEKELKKKAEKIRPPKSPSIQAIPLKSPTSQQRKLAATKGQSPEQIQARQVVARHFLATDATYWDWQNGKLQPLDEGRQQGIMDGIDWNNPVEAGPPPPLQKDFVQWQPPGGNRGGFFAEDGCQPEDLGIGSLGRAWGIEGQPVKRREKTQYRVATELPYLLSVAAPTTDDWAVPGYEQVAPGGCHQWFVPTAADPSVKLAPA